MNCFTKYYIYAKMKGCDKLYDDILIPHIQKTESEHNLEILEAYESNLENLPLVADLDDVEQKIFIFDDLINSSSKDLNNIQDYFIMSRKKNCSLVFISQNYYSIPKVIRNNITTVCITKVDSSRDLRLIANDICCDDYDEVREHYNSRKDVFIKTIDGKGKTRYITDF